MRRSAISSGFGALCLLLPISHAPDAAAEGRAQDASKIGSLVEPSQQDSPAIRGLLKTARQNLAHGKLDLAEAATERALRIAPSARVWHYLAQIRYYQRDYEQAKSMAQKSDGLDGDGALKAYNKAVIELTGHPGLARHDQASVGRLLAQEIGRQKDLIAKQQAEERLAQIEYEQEPERLAETSNGFGNEESAAEVEDPAFDRSAMNPPLVEARPEGEPEMTGGFAKLEVDGSGTESNISTDESVPPTGRDSIIAVDRSPVAYVETGASHHDFKTYRRLVRLGPH